MIAKMAAPVTASELQLYRVLQRANLLQYYETFIAQGGDDVQQLCEAGEEEFLEIMALVGMASKPLHVRRLQKALQEWVTNPAVFQQPLVAAKSAIAKVSPTASMPPSVQRAPQVVSYTSVSPVGSVWTPPTVASIESASREAISLIRSTSPNGDSRDGSSPSHSNHANTIVIDASQHMDAAKLHGGKRSPGPHSGSHTMLSDTQIQAIRDAAEALVKTLPPYAPKPMNMRKEICRDIERVMNMDRDDPARPDQIYKYSAIYGRFDSKRKNDKPMSLHEISVNEAAAQICMQMSSLLTRRDELFPLARDVVRDSGYQYSKGHSRAASADPPSLSTPAKKAKLDHDAGDHPKTPRAEMERMQREARLAGIKEELVVVAQTQEQLKSEVQAAKAEENYNLIHQLQSQLEELTSKHLGLLTEESDLTRKQKRALKSQRYMMSKAGTPLPMEETDSGLASGGASPANGLQDASDIYAALKNNNTSQFTKDSLFNEGLRIAQQYGMADFAEELKGMQPTEEEVDEQSEWNREVEKDAEQSAVSAEQSTVSAEQSAVSAEQAAVSAEQAAVSAEQAAVSASNNNGKHDDSNDTVTNGNIVKTETTTEIVETAS